MMDTNGDRKIDKQEFYWGLKDLGCSISKKEAGILLEALDTNADGFVNFDEFLVGLRGRPNATRQKDINRAFQSGMSQHLVIVVLAARKVFLDGKNMSILSS